ncbi:MAG: glycosyltransferase family 2 protein [Patescibacteria group bacterium]
MQKITIVTPSYNQGPFLEETILSVLSQKGNFYIDYIIADGGSKDQSVEIIKKYDQILKKNQFPIKCMGIEFRWWSKKDNGTVDALNKGFKEAKGDILAYIASDDFYEPNVFDIVLKRFQEDSSIVLVHGDCYFYYSKDKKDLKYSTETSFVDLLKIKNVIFSPSTFFIKKILDKVGFIDESFEYAADLDLWLKISKIGKTSYVPHVLSNFRVWENSKSTLLSDKFLMRERKRLLKRYGGQKN